MHPALGPTLVVLALLAAGCSAPAAIDETGAPPDGGNASGATLTPVPATLPTTTPSEPRVSPWAKVMEGGEPCAQSKARNASAPTSARVEVDAAPGVRRAEVAAAQQGVANARRYLAACVGPEAPAGEASALVLRLRNGTDAPATALDADGARVVIAIGTDADLWRAPLGAWPTAVHQPHLAARETARAWQLAWGCRDASAIPWLHDGFAQHVAYAASMMAGDLPPEDSYPFAWGLARSAGALDATLAASPAPALVGLFAVEGLFRIAPEGGMQAYCQSLASGMPAEKAYETAFNTTLEETEAFWAMLRASNLFEGQGGSSRAHGAPPGKRALPCLADVRDGGEPPLRANASAGVPAADVALLERAVTLGASFTATCYGLTLPAHQEGRLRLNVTATGEGNMGGSSWMTGDGSGIEIGFDVGHRNWMEQPREFPDASRLAQGASLFSTAVIETNDCRPSNGRLPAWLREGILQYAGWSSAIRSGLADEPAVRSFLWANAGHGGALGIPLRDMEEYGPNAPWPGNVGFFVAERLLAESEDGPAAVGTFCTSLREGASLTSAFAGAFGTTYDAVAGDAGWLTRAGL